MLFEKQEFLLENCAMGGGRQRLACSVSGSWHGVLVGMSAARLFFIVQLDTSFACFVDFRLSLKLRYLPCCSFFATRLLCVVALNIDQAVRTQVASAGVRMPLTTTLKHSLHGVVELASSTGYKLIVLCVGSDGRHRDK
jgi:hypothetical protein